jgi:hypothetical protein
VNSSGEVKETPSLFAVKMAANLRAILAIVGVLRWGLDDVNVGLLCRVCRPLDRHTRQTDADNDAVEEFKFWNEKMSEGLAPLPNPRSSVKNSMLVLVEKIQRAGYFGESVIIDQERLC